MAYIGKSPSNGIRNRFIYTATAGQTSFSGSDDHDRTLNYNDAEFVDVFLNGVKLDKSDYTATSGTSVVLDEGAAADDILEVLAFDVFSVFSGEFSQDVTVGGKLTTDNINGGQIGGRRNFIYNGAMTVNQRGNSTGLSSVAYVLDRWEVSMFNVGTGTIDVSQDTDAPNGFFQSMKVETNAADSSQDTNAQFYIQQQIEAQDINHLKFYESSPDSVTISFWVKSNLTGSFPMALKLSDNNSADNNTNTRIYNTTYSISTADTWEKKTATITLDSSTSETKPTGNNFGMALVFWLAAGSNRDGANADVWEGNGNATIAADNLDLLANAANEWYVTGVQIEKGSTATEFEHRRYGEELALCQRYYQIWSVGWSGYASISGQNISAQCNFNTTMRTTPTVTRTGGYAPTRYPASAAFIINQDVDGFVGGSVSQSLGGNDNWRHDGTAEAEL